MNNSASSTARRDEVDPITRQVGRRIAAARRAAGLTQAELADRLNWPYDTYIHYEHGRRSIGVDRLTAIASALGISPAVLLVDDETLGSLIRRLVSDPDLAKQVRFFLDVLAAEPAE